MKPLIREQISVTIQIGNDNFLNVIYILNLFVNLLKWEAFK